MTTSIDKCNMPLTISEYFLSIQGEGKFAGEPRLFLRTAGCNLNCVWCDTVEVWKRGIKKSVNDWAEEILDKFAITLLKGAGIVLTGGEPLLQQGALATLINHITSRIGWKPFVEVETNCTIKPLPEFDALIDHYSCSPKLSNSDEPKERRITKALRYFVNNPKATFKFVVGSEDDIAELLRDFIIPFSIPNWQVWLMPKAANKEELEMVAPFVVEKALMYGWSYSDRLQIRLWNTTTGR